MIHPESSSDTDILHRARNYPYAAPPGSYTWESGVERAFRAEDRAGRVPVLAFGSNRSPERLAQKFRHLGTHVIPVERARLRDFDTVYAAHITAYGAVPAMLQEAPGVRVEIAVTWLDKAQLVIMTQSEVAAANYAYALLDGIDLMLEGNESLDHAFAYVSTRGHLRGATGEAVPLLAVRAKGRKAEALATGEMLEQVRLRVAPEAAPDDFVLRLVRDAEYRHSVSEILSRDAVPFTYTDYRIWS